MEVQACSNTFIVAVVYIPFEVLYSNSTLRKSYPRDFFAPSTLI